MATEQDSPMVSRTRPRAILHIGMEKTGSTTLQVTLSEIGGPNLTSSASVDFKNAGDTG